MSLISTSRPLSLRTPLAALLAACALASIPTAVVFAEPPTDLTNALDHSETSSSVLTPQFSDYEVTDLSDSSVGSPNVSGELQPSATANGEPWISGAAVFGARAFKYVPEVARAGGRSSNPYALGIALLAVGVGAVLSEEETVTEIEFGTPEELELERRRQLEEFVREDLGGATVEFRPGAVMPGVDDGGLVEEGSKAPEPETILPTYIDLIVPNISEWLPPLTETPTATPIEWQSPCSTPPCIDAPVPVPEEAEPPRTSAMSAADSPETPPAGSPAPEPGPPGKGADGAATSADPDAPGSDDEFIKTRSDAIQHQRDGTLSPQRLSSERLAELLTETNRILEQITRDRRSALSGLGSREQLPDDPLPSIQEAERSFLVAEAENRALADILETVLMDRGRTDLIERSYPEHGSHADGIYRDRDDVTGRGKRVEVDDEELGQLTDPIDDNTSGITAVASSPPPKQTAAEVAAERLYFRAIDEFHGTGRGRPLTKDELARVAARHAEEVRPLEERRANASPTDAAVIRDVLAEREQFMRWVNGRLTPLTRRTVVAELPSESPLPESTLASGPTTASAPAAALQTEAEPATDLEQLESDVEPKPERQRPSKQSPEDYARRHLSELLKAIAAGKSDAELFVMLGDPGPPALRELLRVAKNLPAEDLSRQQALGLLGRYTGADVRGTLITETGADSRAHKLRAATKSENPTSRDWAVKEIARMRIRTPGAFETTRKAVEGKLAEDPADASWQATKDLFDKAATQLPPPAGNEKRFLGPDVPWFP